MGENPVFSIWYRTGEVIEEKLENTSGKEMFWLITVFGIISMMDIASSINMGDKFSLAEILILSVIIGPLVGALNWGIYSLIVHGTSRLLGGAGTWRETRTTVAWATVIYSAKLLLWIPLLFLFGHELFLEETMALANNLFLTVLFYLFSLFEFILQIVFIIVLSKGLAVAHRFSAWRGFGAQAILFAVNVFVILLRLFAG